MDKDQYQVEYLGETKQGYGLWRKKEPHGGWSYWTDEVAPYILVFDEALDNPMSMFEALEHLGLGERMWQSIGASFDYTQR